MNQPKVFPKSIAVLIFVIGMISALSFRAIIIVQHSNPSYVRALWYVAVITNLIFFLFRYYVSRKRKRAVNSNALIAKLNQEQPLETRERRALVYLLTSIERSHENLNYLVIFILSAAAIIIDVIMTLRA